MGIYLRPDVVKWSLRQLSNLPKNQTVLLFFLVFARCPNIGHKKAGGRQRFEEEFYRYFGAPIKGDGVAPFDPFGGIWLASEYINSTVYGRLLAGSHKWTEGQEAFFSRSPKAGGWPARFELTNDGFDNLKLRASPPCLASRYRLPLTATAAYYFRFRDLSTFAPKDLDDIVEEYRRQVLTLHPCLPGLFNPGPRYPDVVLQTEVPTEEHQLKCYPRSPLRGEPQTNQRLYQSDVEAMRSMLKDGETIADLIHSLLKEGKR